MSQLESNYIETSPRKMPLWSTLFSVVFIVFWFVVLATQLHDFIKFKAEIYNQIFPAFVSHALIYVLPSAEICVAALLVWRMTTLTGLALSFLLMLAFTVYVGLALLNVYTRMPCSCAGLLGHNTIVLIKYRFPQVVCIIT